MASGYSSTAKQAPRAWGSASAWRMCRASSWSRSIPAKRKDLDARLKLMREVDVAISVPAPTMPPGKWRSAGAMARETARRLKRRIAVRRTGSDGFAELERGQAEKDRQGASGQQPGCYPTGMDCAGAALVDAGDPADGATRPASLRLRLILAAAAR